MDVITYTCSNRDVGLTKSVSNRTKIECTIGAGGEIIHYIVSVPWQSPVLA